MHFHTRYFSDNNRYLEIYDREEKRRKFDKHFKIKGVFIALFISFPILFFLIAPLILKNI